MNRAARARITAARAALVMNPQFAFYGALSLNMALDEDSSFDTAATDGKRIVYNPSFILSLSEPECIGLVCHEVEHVARLHHVRRGNRDPELWNVACDFSINPDLIAADLTLPEGLLFDSRFVGMASEDIYAILAKPEPAPEPDAADDAGQDPDEGNGPQGDGAPAPGGPDEGDEGDGNGPGADGADGSQDGAGGPPDGTGDDGAADGTEGTGKPAPGNAKADPGRCGGVIDAADNPADMAEAAAESEIAVRQAAMVAAAQGEGRAPGHIGRVVGELTAGRVDWKSELRRYADASAIRDYDWSRPNRRYAGAAFVLPSLQTIAPAHVVFIVDSSGSMNDRAVTAGLSHGQTMLDQGAVERLTVLYCDTRVHRAESYVAGDLIAPKPEGGGGTRFAPAFDWMRDNVPDASLAVYFTDLDCSDFGDAPDCPVLWAATDPVAARRPVPWGDVLLIDPHA